MAGSAQPATALTQLPGRREFASLVAAALEASNDRDTGVALVCIDVDDFKRFNEVLGHDAGDQLLRAIASRLAAIVRPGDRVAHLGADEFAVVCSGVIRDTDAVRIGQRFSSALAEPFAAGDTSVALTVSVGIAVGDGLGQSPQDMLRDAGTALHRAKRTRSGATEVFDETHRRSAIARLQTENALRKALEEDELTVAYQPIVSLRDGEVRGFEALVRWSHDALGQISPLEFIPIAEESGLILPLGRSVLTRSCHDIAALDAKAPQRHFNVAVNLSPRQVLDPELPGVIESSLEAADLDPACLHLELTEGILVDHNPNVRDALLRLRRIGVRIMIDDFGTGYSALSYLTRLPVDGVKIDHSFVTHLGGATVESAIVEAVISLGRNIGLDVIAEGVETQGQADELREMGCLHAQGFFFGRPTPAAYLDLLL